MTAVPTHRPTAAPRPSGGAPRDWHDAFLAMEQRYLQSQVQLRDKEETLRMVKVESRKAEDRLKKEVVAVMAGQQIDGQVMASLMKDTSHQALPSTSVVSKPGSTLVNRGRTSAKGRASSSQPGPRRVASPSANNTPNPLPAVHHVSPPRVSTPPRPAATVGSSLHDVSGASSSGHTLGGGGQGYTSTPTKRPPMEYVTASRQVSSARRGGGGGVRHGVARTPMSAGGDDGLTPARQSPYSPLLRPEPLMVWGIEDQEVLTQVQCNALLSLNQQLRDQLEREREEVKRAQHEQALSKKTVELLKAQLDEAHALHVAAVRDRDMVTQRLEGANVHLRGLQQQQVAHDEELERVRMGSQVVNRELRDKLRLATDSGDALSKEGSLLMNELKERHLVVIGLQGKLKAATDNIQSQKDTNEALLIEMRSLNSDLANTRRKLLDMTRDYQVATASRNRADDLQKLVDNLRTELRSKETENLRLLEDTIHASRLAGDCAREDVKSQLEELTSAAQHWERVAQLQYKDIATRTLQHQQCREECDDAKQARDEAHLGLRSLRQELLLAESKLELVWPTHRRDTNGLEPEEVGKAFARLAKRHTPASRGVGGEPGGPSSSAATPGIRGGATMGDDSLLDPISLTEQIRELQEANDALVIELETQRLAHDVLSARLKEGHAEIAHRDKHHESTLQNMKLQSIAGQKLALTQADRIRFLEDQVTTLRGTKVDGSFSVSDLAENETIVELFVGQLVASPNEANAALLRDAPQMFCTVDFMVHETVPTPVISGLSGFFDSTYSFKIAMDRLLVYYLRHRRLAVQLHRVDGSVGELSGFSTIAMGDASLEPLLDTDRLTAARPTLRGSVALFDVHSTTGPRVPIACLEFHIVVRAPYSSAFQKLVSSPHDLHHGSNTISGSLDGTTNPQLQLSGQNLSASPSATGLVLPVSSTWSKLRDVRAIVLTVEKVVLDFNLASLPARLSIYSHIAEDTPDHWITPQDSSLVERFTIPFHRSMVVRCSGSNEEQLFRWLRAPWVITLFDDGETNNNNNSGATACWALGLQPLGIVLDHESLRTGSLMVDALTSNGQHRAVIHVTIALEDAAGVEALTPSPTAPGGKQQLPTRPDDGDLSSVSSRPSVVPPRLPPATTSGTPPLTTTSSTPGAPLGAAGPTPPTTGGGSNSARKASSTSGPSPLPPVPGGGDAALTSAAGVMSLDAELMARKLGGGPI